MASYVTVTSKKYSKLTNMSRRTSTNRRRYRKIPYISPGLIEVRNHYLVGILEGSSGLTGDLRITKTSPLGERSKCRGSTNVLFMFIQSPGLIFGAIYKMIFMLVYRGRIFGWPIFKILR